MNFEYTEDFANKLIELRSIKKGNEIKPRIIEMSAKPSEDFIVILYMIENTIITPYVVFKNPDIEESPFTYKIYKIDEMVMWQYRSMDDTPSRDMDLVALCLKKEMYKNVDVCEENSTEIHLTDDYKTMLGMRSVRRYKMRDYDARPMIVGRKWLDFEITFIDI